MKLVGLPVPSALLLLKPNCLKPNPAEVSDIKMSEMSEMLSHFVPYNTISDILFFTIPFQTFCSLQEFQTFCSFQYHIRHFVPYNTISDILFLTIPYQTFCSLQYHIRHFVPYNTISDILFLTISFQTFFFLQ